MARDLKLGLNFGYWAGGPPPTALESLKEAERLGFDSCWTAEAYGSDSLIPLAWWGSETERIKLGTALVQLSARTPAATAMAAMTLDHLSGGRVNIAMAAELCDGWLAIFYSPEHEDLYEEPLKEGFGRPNALRTPDEFEVAATVPLIVTDDIESAANMMRPMYALYFGGMGAKSANFHANVPIRMGYEADVRKIQDLYLEGKKEDAMAAVPQKLIEELTLIGPKEKIRDELEAWRESAVTTLLISGDPQMLRDAAELVLG